MQLRVETLGSGSEWISGYLPSLLGVDFLPPRLDKPAKLRTIAKRCAGMRIVTLPAISLRLVQIILQQLISFRDACTGWRRLVHCHGTQVPGHDDLWFPPSPKSLARLVSYQFVECGVLPKHGRTIVEAMRLAARIEAKWNAGQDSKAVESTCSMLQRIRGIGPWTTGFLRGAGLGDSDAEVLGDYSHPKYVAHFFGGSAKADDREMLRLLAPFRPHRFYVLSLLIQGTGGPPRRGPKRTSLHERFRF